MSKIWSKFIKSSTLAEAERKIIKLLQDDIKKKGVIKTGDMLRSVNPIFKEEGDDISIELEAVEYYVYQDDGTKYIKAHNFTDDVINSKAFLKIIEEVAFLYYEMHVDEMLVELGNKNKKIKIKK